VHSAGLIDLGVVGTGVDRGGDAVGSCAGRVFQTEGIAALSPADQSAIREKVETFDAFTLHWTTTRMVSTTSAASSTTGSECSGRSTTTTETWNMAAKTRPIRLRRRAC
jgi:hypothetical protein